MTAKGLRFRLETMNPTTITPSHTPLNFFESDPPFQPRTPEEANAAAYGAVRAELIPAAKKPRPNRKLVNVPNRGLSCWAS